jgi:hypothetical protein
MLVDALRMRSKPDGRPRLRGLCNHVPTWRLAIVLSAACLALPGAAGSPAQAQGFSDRSFDAGWLPRLPPSPFRPYSAYVPFDPQDYRDAAAWSADRGTTYRTLCVRLCDGYYWPISHSVTRGRFHQDADACRSSCGSEAGLFYQPSDGDVSDMVDLSGRSYSALPHAYLYRRTLVEGCRCRPEPWSAAEAERHRLYKLNETEDRARRLGGSAVKGPGLDRD